MQSSTAHSGEAARAVDGNRSGVYRQDSTTHTNTEDQPWWRVDLGSPQTIGEIIIANRTDGEAGLRLVGAKVLVGNIDSTNPADYTEVGTLTSDDLITLSNLSATGRYVMIRHEAAAAILSLSEVEIYASQDPGTNTINAGVIGTHAFVKSHTSFPTAGFINRGNFVVSRLTCGDLPADVPSEAFGVEGLTNPELFENLKGQACATCHHIFDNYGVQFQQFDDETGFYSPTRSPYGNNFSLFEIGDIFGNLDGTVEALGSTLANSESAAECFSGLLYRHAFRRSLDENDGDSEQIGQYVSDWINANNSDLKSLLRIIALSDSFITLYE